MVVRDAKYVQEVFLSLMQNETFANAWADHGMDSIVQTVAKVGKKKKKYWRLKKKKDGACGLHVVYIKDATLDVF